MLRILLQSISFTSIGGLDGHIRSLKESVFLPLTYPEVFEKLGIKVTLADAQCQYGSTMRSRIRTRLLPCIFRTGSSGCIY